MSIRSILRFLKRRAGELLGLVSFVACLFWRQEIGANFHTHLWNISNFYTAVFDWAAIQSGFLFGVYTYVVSKSAGFVGAIRETSAYAEMVFFIRSIFYLVFALTVLSIPLLIVTPEPNASLGLPTLIFALWVALVVYTLFSFIRIIRAFAAIERVRRIRK